jgi:hypothetical protein
MLRYLEPAMQPYTNRPNIRLHHPVHIGLQYFGVRGEPPKQLGDFVSGCREDDAYATACEECAVAAPAVSG